MARTNAITRLDAGTLDTCPRPARVTHRTVRRSCDPATGKVSREKEGVTMDHNTTTNPETDSVWLTDSEGNNYLVPRDVIAHLIVPSAISAQVKDFVEADTHGYGNGMWAMIGVKDHWGQTSKDKGFDSNFDF